MANYKLVHSEPAPRVELHEALGLTGAEVSINTVPPNGGVPFAHVHTNNEELYIVLEGKGELWIDGETLPIQAGDSFRIDPAGKRAIRAAADSSLKYICVQTKAHSLGGFTMTDAKLVDDKAPWMK
ncbi:MAG: cupin domain-containing protein [Sutterella sp.]|uniref:cupin domain-containing protein n=1 Tax=Dakarella massiliensis TaxID=1506471 RepID=UPI0003386548|nr:cupin domain-containing protein [Dakarella massiliensis]MBS6157552.1 cupin domain-containing protein [Sutterella sp.]CDE47666.1 putative uncharacterized protein [Sutterella sp. CAG:351]